MKSTKETIKEMEKEFDERFPGDVTTMKEDGMYARITSSLYNRDRLKDFIHSYTRTLLESFGKEVIKNFMEDLNYYNSDKPPCTEDSPCGCHFGEVFHADGMCICDIEKRQRRKVQEIISSIGK